MRVLIASNNFRERAASYAARLPELTEAVDKIYYSWQTGFVKPDPQVFTNILKQESLQPAEALYFDDVPENVAVAKTVGMQAALFENLTTMEQIIVRERARND